MIDYRIENINCSSNHKFRRRIKAEEKMEVNMHLGTLLIIIKNVRLIW